MKHSFVWLPATAIFILTFTACKSSLKTADNSANALDWAGTYYGVIPCADCAGIITTITLNSDKSYLLKTSYRGKSEEVFADEGNFQWNDKGNIITLSTKDEQHARFYKVGESRLVQLDSEGKEITGNLSSQYILQKQVNSIVNKYWKLVEVNGKAVVMGDNWRHEPHMILHDGGMRVTGHGGCNSFTGSFELSENERIKFTSVAATKMFCEGASETESMFFRALETADSYLVEGDKLQLFRARMAPLARFEAVYLR